MAEDPSAIVRLDVGGRLFKTTVSTLRADPDSMLAAMFSGRHTLPIDESGNVFIDRDGLLFEHVLAWLRTGQTPMDPSPREAEMLMREADFYQLRGLLRQLLPLVPKNFRLKHSKSDWLLEEEEIETDAGEDVTSDNLQAFVQGHKVAVRRLQGARLSELASQLIPVKEAILDAIQELLRSKPQWSPCKGGGTPLQQIGERLDALEREDLSICVQIRQASGTIDQKCKAAAAQHRQNNMYLPRYTYEVEKFPNSSALFLVSVSDDVLFAVLDSEKQTMGDVHEALRWDLAAHHDLDVVISKAAYALNFGSVKDGLVAVTAQRVHGERFPERFSRVGVVVYAWEVDVSVCLPSR